MNTEELAHLRKELGERMKAAREQARDGRGFKQSEVGAALDKQDRTVSAWETGRAFPDVPTLLWMAHNYGVSIDELLGLKQPPSGGQFREAAEIVAAACGSTRLPPAAFLRVVDRVMQTNFEDERERRGFIKGLVAGLAIDT